MHHVDRFMSRLEDPTLDDVGEEEVRAYLHHLVDERKVSPYTQKAATAALKFLFERTLGRPEVTKPIPWPTITSPLPAVLSARELVAIFRAAPSPQQRVALVCMYGTGVRVSEVCRLRPEDIDSERGVVLVRKGKGNRDRQTVLPDRLLENLRRWWRNDRPSTGPWLFPSRQSRSGHVTDRHVREGFNRAVAAAGVRREGVRLHSLRHSFATHMLEAGVDVAVVQAMLGHRSIQTTTRYAQVRTDLIASVPDPLERLVDSVRKG